MNSEAGKGDAYRKVDFKKFDPNYLRLYGMRCPECIETPGEIDFFGIKQKCPMCGGIGYVEVPTIKVKCKKCHGSGRVQTSHVAITGPCQKCGGTGYVKRKVRNNATRKDQRSNR